MTLLDEAYGALTEVVASLTDDMAWTGTGCTGWTVQDLVWHLHADAVRGLVAAHTPAPGAADCDAVGYWRSWGSDAAADARNLRLTRVEAGLHPFAALRDRHLEAAAAAVRAVGGLEDQAVVLTQGHAISAADLASTLAVEATLHHVDLVVELGHDVARPAPGPMAEVRRVVEAMLDTHLTGWSDERVALVGTGRAPATAAERHTLGGASLPVFT